MFPLMRYITKPLLLHNLLHTMSFLDMLPLKMTVQPGGRNLNASFAHLVSA